MKRLLHIFILTQALILLGGIGHVSSHEAATFISNQPYAPQISAPHMLAGTRVLSGQIQSATHRDSIHWLISFITEVESENEENRAESDKKYILASRYLLNLLSEGISSEGTVRNCAIAFVSEQLTNSFSERIYLVQAVFRL